MNYGGGGSGKGRTDLAGGVVDYAGSDSPIKAEDLPTFKGGTVLYFPVVVGPITASYNVSGVDQQLQLDGPTLANIFQGKVTKWNDPSIAAQNSGVTLPGHDDRDRPPVRLVGHHGQLLAVPRQVVRGRLDARHRLHDHLAGQQPGR